ncbi:hypothetical protein D4R52_01980 [bacterium]|nr:MAG: hypothetical protein D4R52_01980 [bacterium]
MGENINNMNSEPAEQKPEAEGAKAEPKEEPRQAAKEVVREIHHYHHHRRGGIFRLFFGLLFVVAGLGFLAQSFGWVPGINLGYFFAQFWPVLVILMGLSILSRGSWVGYVLSILIFLGLIGLIVGTFVWPGSLGQVEQFNFDLPKDQAARGADISVSVGASTVKIKGSETGFVSGELKSNITRLVTDNRLSDTTQEVSIRLDGQVRRVAGHFTNDLTVNLPENLPTALTVDAGASNLDMDLSAVQINDLKIDAGASKLALVLGDKAETGTVEIRAGASSINISLPKDVGAKMGVKANLSSKTFIDFRQIDEQTYESANYASATKKINLQIDAGASSITVNWR